MDRNSEYCITTGEFARLCGTTRDTLRHYNDIGLMTPYKDEENGYYYYSISQVTYFYFITLFRDLKVSLKDIQNFVNDADKANYYNFCTDQLNNLLKIRSEIDEKISELTNTTVLLRFIKKYEMNEPHLTWLYNKLNFYYTPITSSTPASSKDIIDDMREHIHTAQKIRNIFTYPVAATMDKDDFMNGRYRYKWLCSHCSPKYKGKNTDQLPSTRIVGCACEDGNMDIRKIYKKMADFIREKDLVPISDFFSISLLNYTDMTGTKNYLKYMGICVRKPD